VAWRGLVTRLAARAGLVAHRWPANRFDVYDFGMLASRPRDRRLRIRDAVFVRRDSQLATDVSWD